MGYTKETESTWVRTKHIVEFRMNSRIVDIWADMRQMPVEAKFTDYDFDDETNIMRLTFIEERSKKPKEYLKD